MSLAEEDSSTKPDPLDIKVDGKDQIERDLDNA